MTTVLFAGIRRSLFPYLIGTSAAAIICASSGLANDGKDVSTKKEAAETADPEAGVVVTAGGAVTVYNRIYFDGFNNIISALDLVDRIPGTSFILSRGRDGGGSSRGFGTNDDGVLINGKRLTGKDNDSSSTLSRILADQVERVEIIRGSSPDVKVSSQEAMLNVVLKEGAASKSSGTWRVDTRTTKGGRFKATGGLTYSGALGRLDYFVEAKRSPFIADPVQVEDVFDANDQLLSRLIERTDHLWQEDQISTNLTYNFENGDALNINGVIKDSKMIRYWTGDLFVAQAGGAFGPVGNNARDVMNKRPSWEIGGDYGTTFGASTDFKIKALYAQRDMTLTQSEDYLIEGTRQDDFEFIFDKKATEAIIRPSFSFPLTASLSIEIGDELAYNKVENDLSFSTLENGVLVPQDVSGSNVTVDEKRSETFANLSWKISNKLTLDSAMTFEYSKISQSSSGAERSETFKFWRPTADLRYDIDDKHQLQFSVRRTVSQLNFSDFASTVSDDDKIVGANEDLVPERAWLFEGSISHQFAGDAGTIKAKVTHERITDAIQLIEVSEGVSGVGNVGSATRTAYGLDVSYKFDNWGFKGVRLEAEMTYNASTVTDPFTGERRRLNGQQRTRMNASIQHDIDSIGLSYGIDWWHMGKSQFRDINETRRDLGTFDFIGLFAKYRLMKSVTIETKLVNIFNHTDGRERILFDGPISGGQISEIQRRTQNWGTRLRFGLKGTF